MTANLRSDLSVIATELRDAAIANDLCSAYDDFVDTVNAMTSELHLIPRRHTHEFCVRMNITIITEQDDPDEVQAELESLLGSQHDRLDSEYTVDSWDVSF